MTGIHINLRGHHTPPKVTAPPGGFPPVPAPGAPAIGGPIGGPRAPAIGAPGVPQIGPPRISPPGVTGAVGDAIGDVVGGAVGAVGSAVGNAVGSALGGGTSGGGGGDMPTWMKALLVAQGANAALLQKQSGDYAKRALDTVQGDYNTAAPLRSAGMSGMLDPGAGIAPRIAAIPNRNPYSRPYSGGARPSWPNGPGTGTGGVPAGVPAQHPGGYGAGTPGVPAGAFSPALTGAIGGLNVPAYGGALPGVPRGAPAAGGPNAPAFGGLLPGAPRFDQQPTIGSGGGGGSGDPGETVIRNPDGAIVRDVKDAYAPVNGRVRMTDQGPITEGGRNLWDSPWFQANNLPMEQWLKQHTTAPQGNDTNWQLDPEALAAIKQFGVSGGAHVGGGDGNAFTTVGDYDPTTGYLNGSHGFGMAPTTDPTAPKDASGGWHSGFANGAVGTYTPEEIQWISAERAKQGIPPIIADAYGHIRDADPMAFAMWQAQAHPMPAGSKGADLMAANGGLDPAQVVQQPGGGFVQAGPGVGQPSPTLTPTAPRPTPTTMPPPPTPVTESFPPAPPPASPVLTAAADPTLGMAPGALGGLGGAPALPPALAAALSASLGARRQRPPQFALPGPDEEAL